MFNLLQSQSDLFASLKTSFLEDNISLLKINGFESISKLYEYKIYFQLSELSVDVDNILGSSATIILNSPDKTKYINGIISNFSENADVFQNDSYVSTYSLIIRPKLWRLTLDQDCKIFQNKTVIDIIKSVLKDKGITDISDKTSKCGKTKKEYCVQYNESSFNFISRLMEDAGIFYFFTHEENKHTLVLGDSSSVYKKIEGQSEIEYLSGMNKNIPLDRIYNMHIDASMHTGEYAMADYNYKTSQTKLLSKLQTKWKGEKFFEYPGGFNTTKEGDDIAKLRVQAIEFHRSLLFGSSTVINFSTGTKFTLKHDSKRFKGTYVIYSFELHFEISNNNILFNITFTAFKDDVEFRPIKETPKPKIYGVQPAIVVGPNGKEIYRNEDLAIKVKFYWDQYGKDADTCSCWIRVSQPLAGSGYGTVLVSRIGQEVAVLFIDGNPDSPVIIGSLYNDQNKPPYSDSEAMISTLKTQSFTNDKGFNEIKLNDEKDKEEIYIHAQKDNTIEIENLRKTTIKKSDDILEIQEGSKETKLLAKGDKSANYLLEMTKGDKTEKITEGNFVFQGDKGNMSITLSEGNFSQSLKKGNVSLKLDKGNETIDITGDWKLKVSGSVTIEADGDITLKGKNISLKANQSVKIESGTALDLKSGTSLGCKAGTEMSCSATTNFAVKANVNAEIKANVGATIQGTVNAKLSGAIAEVSGTGTAKVSAPLITVGGGMVQLG